MSEEIKTRGGCVISNFQAIPHIKRPDLDSFIYSGEIYDPEIKKTLTLYWTEQGECPNPNRRDCDLDPYVCPRCYVDRARKLKILKKSGLLNFPEKVIIKENITCIACGATLNQSEINNIYYCPNCD